MECEFGDFACKAIASIGFNGTEITGLWRKVVELAVWLYEIIRPHMQSLSLVFGAVMAAWRWYDKRAAVVFGRIDKLLGDEGRKVREACQHSLLKVTRPGPETRPDVPLFAAKALRRVFNRWRWRPVLSTGGPLTIAERALARSHRTLDSKDDTAANYKTFLIEQRFSAFALEGAIASARSGATKDRQRRLDLGSVALQKFDEALQVEGKSSDFQVLELRAIQMRKLGRAAAAQEFDRVRRLIEERLTATPVPTAKERNSHFARLVRVVRYRAEIDHEIGRHRAATDGMLDLLEAQHQRFQTRLTWRDLLERAQFHEVHGCVRVELAGLGPAADQSLSAATADYSELVKQLDARRRPLLPRVWFWISRLDHRTGAAQLRQLAREGLARIEAIRNGKGCLLCLSGGQSKPPAPASPPEPQSPEAVRTSEANQ